MKYFLFVLSAVLCISCEEKTKAEQTVDTLKNVTEQYINDVNNASSIEDVGRIRKEYRDRVKFEENKLTKEEKDEYMRNVSWETKKELENLNDRADDATNNAVKKYKTRR